MLVYEAVAKWLNDNQGVLGAAIFLLTLGLGWVSGIFSALRRKPKFKIGLLPGPNLCCTFPTGKLEGHYQVHRTAISLYLAIANVGSASSSIESVAVGYHCHLHPFSWQWLRYTFGWYWLRDQMAAIHDFQASIGENIKIYPFLVQSSILSGKSAITFLQPGQATNGVVYFEQPDSWGGLFPAPSRRGARVKVELQDTFGGRHSAKFYIEIATIERARTFNRSFGKTLAELRNEKLPNDQDS